MNRREFLQAGAASSGLVLADARDLAPAPAAAFPAPAAEIVAMRQVSKKKPRTYADYREMLREKDLDGDEEANRRLTRPYRSSWTHPVAANT
jgi:hypothetical protein